MRNVEWGLASGVWGIPKTQDPRPKTQDPRPKTRDPPSGFDSLPRRLPFGIKFGILMAFLRSEPGLMK